MACINQSHPDVVKISGELNVSPVVAAAKIGVWQSKNNIEDRFPTVDELQQPNEVNTTLKSVDILQSDKAKQVFDKGKKANWDLNKILTELQVPKEQKQLILEMYNNMTIYEDKVLSLREQIALELASNYSYAVEINTAMEKAGGTFEQLAARGLNPFEEAEEDTPETTTRVATQHYSNLTVPGGTNYTENEIATPLITPSIKGHAQFSTSNGIGWFRSDEFQQYQGTDIQSIIDNLQKSGQLEINCK